jgi:hypothetical protein
MLTSRIYYQQLINGSAVYLVHAGVRDAAIVTVWPCYSVYSRANRLSWHPGLTEEFSINIEQFQKRLMKLICPTK